MKQMVRVSVLAALMTAAAIPQGHAQSKTVIDRNVLRQMVQLSVAFTQARISFTSPPYPVQFVETSPFRATALTRTASATQPVVNPSAGTQPNTNPLFQLAASLAPGTYTLTATPQMYTLSGGTTNRTGSIPATLQPFLPSNSIMSTVSVSSARTQGRVVVNYTFTR